MDRKGNKKGSRKGNKKGSRKGNKKGSRKTGFNSQSQHGRQSQIARPRSHTTGHSSRIPKGHVKKTSTSHIAKRISIEAADTPRSKLRMINGTPKAKSGIPKTKSGTPKAKSGTPKAKSGTPKPRSGSPRTRSGTVGNARSSSPRTRSSTVGNARSSSPKSRSNSTKKRSSIPRAGNLTTSHGGRSSLKIGMPSPRAGKSNKGGVPSPIGGRSSLKVGRSSLKGGIPSPRSGLPSPRGVGRYSLSSPRGGKDHARQFRAGHGHRKSRSLKRKKKNEKVSSKMNSWEIRTRKRMSRNVRCLAVVKKGLWVADTSGSIHIRSVISGKVKRRRLFGMSMTGKSGRMSFVNAMAQQFKTVWVGNSQGQLRGYSLNGKKVRVGDFSKTNQNGILSINVSEKYDTKFLFVTKTDCTVGIYSTKTGKLLRSLAGHKTWVGCIAVDNYQRQIWSGSSYIRVWSRKCLRGFEKHKKENYDVKVLKMQKKGVTSLLAVDGNMWSGGKHGKIYVWRASDYTMLARWKTKLRSIDCMKLVRNQVFTSCSSKKVVFIWDIVKFGSLIKSFKLPVISNVVDIAHYGKRAWIGGRKNGYLLKYLVSRESRKSQRADKLAVSEEDVDSRTFRDWINTILYNSKNPDRQSMILPDGALPDVIRKGVIWCVVLDEVTGSGDPPVLEPKSEKYYIQNVKYALAVMKKENMKTFNFEPEKLIKNSNLQQICDLVWEIIRKYHIRVGFANNRESKELLRWANKRLKPYIKKNPNITPVFNWNWSWQNGYALSALIDSLEPGCIDFDLLKYDEEEANINRALKCAGQKHDIPLVVDVEDVCCAPTKRSLMTYVAYLRPLDFAKLDLNKSYVKVGQKVRRT